MQEPAIRMRGLSKSYGDREALAGIDLDVAGGETLAILGPNGAGKTTTLEILEGFRARSGGEVTVLGEDPARAGLAWRARLGIVWQTPVDPVPLSVREYVAGFAAVSPTPADVDEVIAAVGLAEQARLRVRALSGGQRRRAEVAAAIVGSPELVFLDEPTTGFDPIARREFWSLIRRLRDAGTTIVLTTHYLDEAEALADRVAVIAGGRILDVGTPDAIGGAEARTPVVRWSEGGVEREERTARPGELVASLVGRLGEPERLRVVRPSLEDVYLGLLGSADPAEVAGVSA